MVADLSQPNSNSRNRPANPSDAVAVIVVSPSRSWNRPPSVGFSRRSLSSAEIAGERDRHEEARNVDIRLALFRQADIGRGPH